MGFCEFKSGCERTSLVWADWFTSSSFGLPTRQLSSTKGEQKRITQTIILNISWLPNSLVPNRGAKCHAEKLKPPTFTSLVWCGRWSNPGLLCLWNENIILHSQIWKHYRANTILSHSNKRFFCESKQSKKLIHYVRCAKIFWVKLVYKDQPRDQ